MWFWIALAVGLLVGALIFWLRSRDISLTWYVWLIGAVGLILLLFTIQNYIGSVAEFEDTAANMFLLVMGLPAIVLLAVAGILSYRRLKS